MPDKPDAKVEENDEDKANADATDKTDGDGKAKGEDDEPKFTQAQVDKAVEKRLVRERAKSAEKEEAAATKAKKDAKEAKLLDDGKLEEFATLKGKEADEAREKLADYERRDQVHALLDKKEVLLPAERALFERVRFDGLEELDKLIDDHNAVIAERVEKEVVARLGTDAPPKGGERQPDVAMRDMTPDQWAAYKKAKGIHGGTRPE